MSYLVQFQLVSDEIATTEPRRGSDGAAGIDLWGLPHSGYTTATIMPHEVQIIPTNIKIWMSKGHYGRIAPRSGVSSRGVMVNAGVIDSDYRGEIKIMLHNLTDHVIMVDLNKPIAQIIIEKYEHVDKIIVHSAKRKIFEDTERGEDGFGSTDKKLKTADEARAEVDEALSIVVSAATDAMINQHMNENYHLFDGDLRECTVEEPCLRIFCNTCYPEPAWGEETQTNTETS